MSFDYAAAAETGAGLIERFGAAVTLKRTTAGSYNPATSSAAETTTTHATTAAVFPYAAKYIDGSLIKQGDQRALMAPDVVPKAGDVLPWQGTDYTVIAVRTIAPAGTAVLHEAQIRG